MRTKVIFKTMAVFFVGLAITFSSCKKDDDKDDNKGGTSIVGKWTFDGVGSDIVNPTNPEAEESAQLTLVFVEAMMQGATLDAKSDGTFSITMTFMGESGTSTGKYVKEGDKYTFSMDDEDESEGLLLSLDSHITVKDNVLTIVSNGLDDEYREMGFTKYTIHIKFKK